MSYYLCDECGAVYKEETKRCSDILCDGYVFEVDELMIMPIKILNKKGYKTQFCCSGHIDRGYCGGYIAFAIGCEPPTVPKDWHMDDKRCIRYSFNRKRLSSPETKYSEILKHMVTLDKWCKELPNKNEEE